MLLTILLVFMPFHQSFLEEVTEETEEFSVPSHVLTIHQENTFPNTSEDQEIIEPSAATEELLSSLTTTIENPRLIKLLNETTIKPSPIGFGYRGMIYLGRWPLNYLSESTTMNWEYQELNINEMNNVGGSEALTMHYVQTEEKKIHGALTNKINQPDDVKNLLLLAAKQKTKLPLSYETVVGKNTKKDYTYNVPTKKQGYLKAHAPAVNEKGQMVFGEVYLELKGTKKALVVKNVTKQGIGAWIPIQDHVSFSFQLKD